MKSVPRLTPATHASHASQAIRAIRAIRAQWVQVAVSAAFALFVSTPAEAQQQTFHLDRLEIPGAPDDGVVLFRPAVQENTIVYAQLGLGLAINPLRTATITDDRASLRASPHDIVTAQISTYVSAGFEILNRLTLGGTFPAAWVQMGNQPTYPNQSFGTSPSITSFSTTGPAIGDIRLDARYVVWRPGDGSQAFGIQVSAFVPSGTTHNFGGDGSPGWMLPMLSYEVRPIRSATFAPTLVANVGLHLRPDNVVNDPAGHNGPAQGLGVGDELRWALGALLPLANGKYRVGLTIFGQTGVLEDNATGKTFFASKNTPLEWNAEGRMNLPLAVTGFDKFFIGGSLGSRLSDGYGAPDFRALALVGSYFQIEDANPTSPSARLHTHLSIHESMKDTDGDGIPDDIDACPEEPEDHKGPDPSDGCPAASDRDGDGIPDNVDKCPDEPEDKDGVDDADGCPEDDADQDGIPDAKDACPKEPGQPDVNPKKNGCPKFIRMEGSNVRILQQVHFQTGSATILADSFPMLGEIAALLKANPDIHKMVIEGHTDNRGDPAMNLDLSARRAASVRTWLMDRGVEGGRLASEGYGLTRPIVSNDTNEGRASNRRVEFKITEQGDGGK